MMRRFQLRLLGRRRIIVLLLIISFTGLIKSLEAQNPRFESYSVLKNRKNVNVNTIYQDQTGYIWLGTNYGLVKFDGTDFVLYTHNDSLAENEVTSIAQDNSGLMWIGHPSGKISMYDGKKFSSFKPEEGLSTDAVSSFLIDRDNVMWFSTFGEGVYYFAGENRKRLYNLNSDEGLLDNFVYTMVQDTNGIIYLGTDKGISVLDPSSMKFIDHISMSDGLPDNIVKSLTIFGKWLWIGMEDGGICRYDLKEKKFSELVNWDFGSLNTFIRLNDNEIWASTKRKGIVKINYDETGKPWFTLYDKNIGLNDVRTKTIFLDRESNIWVGTVNGLCLRKNNELEFFNEKDGLGITDIFSFTIDNQGNYWIASQQGLFKVIKDEMGGLTKQKLFSDKKYTNCSFISLYSDSSGDVWAGTYGFGVFKINSRTNSFINYTTADGLSNNNVIHIDGFGQTIWFSTLGGGISQWKRSSENEFKTFSTDNGLGSNYVYSVSPVSDKKAWISTDGKGVCVIENDHASNFTDSLLNPYGTVVYSVLEDKKHNLWINYKERGIVKFDGKQVEVFDEQNGLRTNSVQSMAFDRKGNLILVDNEGIERLNCDDNSFEYFGEEDGVAYQEPNLNAIYKDKSDNIWIESALGLIRLNADDTTKAEVLPKIVITKKNVFFNEIDNNIHVFRHNKNNLTFYYTALWFKSSGNHIYRYKLEGYDLTWNPETTLRMVTYSNLPPGRYTFKVEVNYSGGKWMGSKDAEYSFRIKPPFWKTIWFISLTIITLIIAVYLFVKMRLRKLQRDKKILEDEVVKRTAEIQKQKEEIEAQRDEIEAQRDFVILQKDQIEMQNKNITSSIQYASRIQNAVLPPKEAFLQNFKDFFIFFQPRDIVSGDFYYLKVQGDAIVVAAADCTGHGVPGAFMSILGISLLNQIIGQFSEPFNAGQILTSLKNEIKRALRQTGKDDEAKDGMDISLCVIQKNEYQIHFAGAYNPLILIRNKEIIAYKGDSMPIGIFLKELGGFTNHTIDIQKGDMLYMYSDGFQDQFGGEMKKKYLAKNLKNLLAEISIQPLDQQQEQLKSIFNTWKGNESQTDDVLVLGIKM